MIAVFDKKNKCCHVVQDKTTAAKIMGVHHETVGRHLPYWDTAQFTMSEAEIVKSNRGMKGAPSNPFGKNSLTS